MTSSLRPVGPDATTQESNVVAAISVQSGMGLDSVLGAVAGQVYEPRRVVVVGGGDDGRAGARAGDVSWEADLRSLMASLDRDITHLWLLHDDAKPRPDALKALVDESARVDASVAGSKLLNYDDPRLLESVGGATDVFGNPYTGLEDGEVDQEQYDVVRDVAFTPGASVLVRRDLLRGLGGPDADLPPLEAGIDFSQRARAAGGRVVVVPSSEVLHAAACGRAVAPWRSRAGRIRSALKVYSLLTLVWLIPVGMALEAVDGLVRLAIGPRRSIFDVLRAWTWNLVRLPSTVKARSSVRRSRQSGDAELFRYQIRGSSLLRRLGDDLTDALRGVGERGGGVVDLVERGRRFWQRPGVIVGLLGVLLVLAAARSIVFGRMPTTGYALHFPESAGETLRAYAGGWNPAELGTSRPLHPSVGFSALIQFVLLGRAALAETVITVGSAILAFLGTSRLLRLLGVGAGGRFIGGVVAFAGPAALALTESGLWSGVPALAAVPFAVGSLLMPWPDGVLRRIGRVASDALPVAVAAAFAPVTIVVPVIAVGAWLLIGRGRRWNALLRAIASTAIALPVMAPWIVSVDLSYILESGRSLYWSPPVWAAVAVGVAFLVALLAGSPETAGIAGWGGVLIGIGAVAARSTDLGWALEPTTAGLVVTSLGSALVAGAAVDSNRGLQGYHVIRRLFSVAGVLAGVLVAGSFVFVLADGALGFGGDRFAEAFEFTTARQADAANGRVLLIGEADRLPGDPRTAEDIEYRAFVAPEPNLTESRLHTPLKGDAALGAMIASLAGEDSLRPGESLAEFGIRWVVFVDPSPLEAAFQSKLDVKPLPLTEFHAVYENLADTSVAMTGDGEQWSWEGDRYAGRNSDQRVRIAINADAGWQPDPAVDDWALTVSAEEGDARYSTDGTRQLYAIVGLAVLILLAFLSLLGRRAER